MAKKRKKRPTRAVREREVLSLTGKLPRLTKAQQDWAFEIATQHKIYTSGRKAWCTCCGHAFEISKETRATKANVGEIECPNCHRMLKLDESRKKTAVRRFYFQIATVCHGWQVLRYFFVESHSKVGQEVWWHEREVFQKWCQPSLPTITIGHRLTAFPYQSYCPFSVWSQAMKVKHSDWYEEWMELKVYPKVKVLPRYKQIGVRVDDTTVPLGTLLNKVYSNPYTERLYKEKDYDQLDEALKNMSALQFWWPSVRIALRHGFEIKSIGNYLDYLRGLQNLGRDMRNPKFVAPADFKAADEEVRAELHAKYEKERIERERQFEERRRAEHERQVKEAKAEQRKYARRIAKFKELDITDGVIDIRPLMSIQEFIDEGNAMHHCVFTNEYYKEKDSLILSAKKDGERVETIEIDLLDFVVAQCYGKYNDFTDFHDEIVALVESNMPVIQKLSKRKHKSTPKAVAYA